MKYMTILMLGFAAFAIVSTVHASASESNSNSNSNSSYQCPTFTEDSKEHKELIELYNNRFVERKNISGSMVSLDGHKFMVRTVGREVMVPRTPAPSVDLKGKYDGEACGYRPVQSAYLLYLIPEENMALFDATGTSKKEKETRSLMAAAAAKIKEDLKVVIDNTQNAYPSLPRQDIIKLMSREVGGMK